MIESTSAVGNEGDRKATPPSTEEHRQFQRISIRQEAQLLPVGHGRLEARPIHVCIQDIGLGGIGVLSPTRLDLDSMWRLSVLRRGHVMADHTFMVRHCRKVQDLQYVVGFQCCLDASFLLATGIDFNRLSDTHHSNSFISSYGLIEDSE